MELVVVNDDQEADDNDQVVHFSRLSCRFLKLGLAMERKIQSAVFAFELDFNKRKTLILCSGAPSWMPPAAPPSPRSGDVNNLKAGRIVVVGLLPPST